MMLLSVKRSKCDQSSHTSALIIMSVSSHTTRSSLARKSVKNSRANPHMPMYLQEK